MRLKDRIALITGGGSGIGQATALRFAREGAAVAVSDVNLEGANQVARDIQAGGGRAIVVEANVARKSDVEAMVEKVLGEFGRLDILINNAGITRDAMSGKMTEEQWDAVLDVNLKGSFLCAQAAARPMVERQFGRIINTASLGVRGNIGQANYVASKAGVIGLTRVLALELARYNITVNCVAPGATETPMTAPIPDKVREMIINKIPLRRMAKPDEIANMHVFLASDEASYITGQTIFVDGGITIGL